MNETSENIVPNLETKEKLQLKKVWFEGFAPDSQIEIAYMRNGNDIIFTATGNVIGINTSTINGCSRVIESICLQEDLDWRNQNLRFFDFQTKLGGYPRRKQENSTALDLLSIDYSKGYPYVDGWGTIFDTSPRFGTEYPKSDSSSVQLENLLLNNTIN